MSSSSRLPPCRDLRGANLPGDTGAIRIPLIARPFYKPPSNRQLPSAKDFPSIDEPPPSVYTVDHLPPPSLISKILDSFYTCSGTLFYICTREQSFELFRSLYWSDCQRTKPALAEICAIAAVGCQYDADGVSNEHRRAFFDTAKIYIDDVVEMSELRAMRLYALCGMYSIMDKRIAAWSYVAAGLKIAQSMGLHKREDEKKLFLENERISWRKNWRTLKFLESWLVGTIGRIPDADHNATPDSIEDLNTSVATDIVENGNRAPKPMVVDVDVMQSELGKIGFIATDIVRNVYAAEKVSIKLIDENMAKLEKWHRELPQYMRFGRVLDENTDQGSRRSIMLIHLTFLGATMLLTRRILTVLVLKPKGEVWDEKAHGGTKQEAIHYMGVCIQAAENVARIVGCLYDEQGLFKRCWMIINQTFNSLALMLFHVVQKRRHKRPIEEYMEHTRFASKCVKVLLFCSTHDNLAHAYLQTFAPYAQFFNFSEDLDLQNVSRELSKYSPKAGDVNSSPVATRGDSPPTIEGLVSSELTEEQLEALAIHLLDIIQKPFGGEGRVDLCPQLLLKPTMTDSEAQHARFWNSRGFKVPAWNRDQPRQGKLPLKRLYEGDKVYGEPSKAAQGKKRKVDDIEAFFKRVI